MASSDGPAAELPPAGPQGRGAVSPHAEDGDARGHPRRHRAHRLRRPLPQALVAPDPLAGQVPHRGGREPAAARLHRGAQGDDRRPARPRDRPERLVDGGRRLAGQPAERLGPRHRGPRAREDPRHPVLEAPPEDPGAPERPADAGHAEGRGLARGHGLPRRAPERVPGSRPQADVPPVVSRRGAVRAGARLRRRDLRRAAEAHAEGGLRRGRPDRTVGCRSRVRPGPARGGRPGRAPRRLARPAEERAARDEDPEAGRLGAPDDRHRAPARRRACAPARHRARARGRRVGGERRLDRRARSEQRRHPRHGVLPDVPAERLHGPGRREAARAAARRGDRQARELPGAEPRDGGDLPAGIDVQADHGARRASGAPRRPVLAAALHGLVHGARRHRRRPGLPQLGSERQPADGDVGGDRGLVRHVLLPPRDDVLRPAARAWAPAPGMGEPLRDRRLDGRRHRARGARNPAHAGVARGDVHERDRQALEAR